MIKNLIKKYKQNRFKKKIIDSLVKNYEIQLETNKILEAWITERILGGQTGRRQELEKKQQEIKEMEEFIRFIKEIRKRI